MAEDIHGPVGEEFIKTLWGGTVLDDGALDLGATIKTPAGVRQPPGDDDFAATLRAAPDADGGDGERMDPGIDEDLLLTRVATAGDAAADQDFVPTMMSPGAGDDSMAPTMVGGKNRMPVTDGSLLPGAGGGTLGSTRVTLRGGSSIMLRHSRLVEAPGAGDAEVDSRIHGGDFVVKRVLGRGGMGIVYIARQASLNRDVAVKMVLPGGGDADAGGKLVSEALVTGELEHPNIIPVYDLGQTDNERLFYAMKIVDGKPWSQNIAENSERQNIDILLRVADAVAFAHDKGVVHRDLKPENVMLGGYGEVLLMDWGLAVSPDDNGKADPLDRTNAKAGTPAYMAPEMAMGQPDSIGPASDIYLLGAILFEILTGKRPHTGRNVFICLQAAADNFIQDVERKDDLVGVALKAMATKPVDRYPSVKDFQESLREVMAHSESVALVRNADESTAEGERTGSYEAYNQAVFAYREAVKLWHANAAAHAGMATVRKKFAARAFANGDFDLAAGNLEGLDDDEARDLAARIARAKAEAEARKRRVRVLTAAAIGLTAAVIVILIGATIIISDRMEKERQARERATQQEQIALQALAETQEARESERRAAEAREEAQREALAALTREKTAQDERLAAIAREEEQRRQREQAERAQREIADEMARLGQLEDDSWWAFDAAEAAARQKAAAAELGTPVTLSLPLAANGPSLELNLIPAGEFVMGSNPRDPLRQPDEYLHRVVLTTPFYMGTTEITRGQWRAVVGIEREEDLMPEFHPEIAGLNQTGESYRAEQLALWGWRVEPVLEAEENLPAVSVSPNEIDALFLPKAAAYAPEGWTFSLPSEAEWEYACRAGTSTQFFNGDIADDFAAPGWTQENSSLHLHAVGEWDANPFGLHDTHGNAAEMVRDTHSAGYYLASPIMDPVNDSAGRYRVVRGGSVIHTFAGSRCASRTNVHADNRYRQVGFRIALYGEEDE